MKKILAFGDSIMKGVVVDTDREISDMKYKVSDESFTEECSRRLGVEIENFGKFGSTVTTGKKIVDRHLAELKEADYVLLKFGGNDSAYRWDEIGDDPSAPHKPNTDIDTFRHNYIEIVDEILDQGVTPVIISMPPIDPEKYYANVMRGLDERQKKNVEKWLGGQPSYIYNWHEIYNLEVFKIAALKKLPFIDITSAFLNRRDFRSLLCPDGMHPNENGHRLIADTICSSLAPAL